MRKRNERVSMTGRVALVTGSGRGIGRAIVEQMLAEGALVAANSMTTHSLDQVAKSLDRRMRARFLPLSGDASDWEFAETSVKRVLRQFGKIDILVNNVGIGLPKPVLELELKEWDRIMDVNLRSAFIWSKLVGAYLLKSKRHGSIVNVSSNLASLARKERAAYIASKAGMLGLTRALAAEWGPFGVRVNAVAPGTIRTDRVRNIMKHGKSSEETYTQRIPLGRIGTPDEIAEVVVFLASDAASFINGSTVFADGGVTATY